MRYSDCTCFVLAIAIVFLVLASPSSCIVLSLLVQMLLFLPAEGHFVLICQYSSRHLC